MHDEIYEKLKEVARARTVTYYNDIAPLAGLDMNLPRDRYEIGVILDDINSHERELGRPMLSAVVVHKESLVPGQGFFTLARSLGLFTGDDRDRFYLEELRKVHDYWASH
ncbi:MAG: hypothetical protein R6V59_03330 [Dehalococcoidia bacterium]